jgi:hypothetical protein
MGSKDLTDYFEGPRGQQIEIDPDIRLSGFSHVGGICSE